MFSKILIANRGEIALRIARTCREMGIAVVCVYSTADADSPVLRVADDAVLIGPAPPGSSYLNIPNIIEAAMQTGAEAIHPGYGFLSEDPDFAEICVDEGLVFIGPDPAVMQVLGDKANARELMSRAGLPLLPGTVSPVETLAEAAAVGSDIGYPVIIKATAGGGGRGMAVVHDPVELRAAYRETRAAAQSVFGDDAVYVERYLSRARHVEVQVLADTHGNVVHLGERDCSVQRRHQKLIEESPSTALDDRQRDELTALAVAGTRAIGYRGAGTIEFLADEHGRLYFMEMNARIQVEHPVSEMRTGIDLVAEQIKVAAGQRLSVRQADIVPTGVAIECRINAEDPARAFAPTPGVLDVFQPPGGPWTRVDSGYVTGSRITAHYDSLIAKLVVWAPDRPQAIARMDRALNEFELRGRGVASTVQFNRRVLRDARFRAGTHWLDLVARMAAEDRAGPPSTDKPLTNETRGGRRHAVPLR
jgi:acetyl-CoA carboxylase, biotin carboxylase subunit